MSLRVLIAVTHLLGAGHLTRAAAIARALARAGHEVTLVSGGMPAPLVSTEALRLVQLPPVRTQGTDFATLLDRAGVPAKPDYLAQRRQMLLTTLAEAEPQVVITELFPFGRRVLAYEFMSLVAAAKRRSRPPLIVASVRDILAASSRPERISETHRRLAEDYSAVLVHGDQGLAPLELSWPVTDAIRHLIRYTGYVDEGSPAPALSPAQRRDVLVSGGSSAASLPLLQAATGAARLTSDLPWRLLVGAGVGEADFAALQHSAPRHAVVERARADFRALLGAAAVSVSQAGYNTAIDLLRTQTPAVLVPFEAGQETEQRLRARCLAKHGLARVLPEQELSPAALAEAVRAALHEQPARVHVRLEGAAETVRIVEELVQAEGAARPRGAGSPAVQKRRDWSAINGLLSRGADEGRTITFWCRDDDATAHTPALDRLLALAGRFELRVALAAIPARLELSLAARLAGQTTTDVLVHGFRHANHAPSFEKKAEFGPHRSPEMLVADAREALKCAKNAFGPELLPVFVPPWNRVAPVLAANLRRLGYCGLSCFAKRAAPEAAPGLFQVNAHLDPVDWRHGRSLVHPATLLAQIAQAIQARLDGSSDREEPIGLLTHHLIQDECVWRFCEEMIEHLSSARAVRFSSARLLFEGPARTHAPLP